MEANFFAPATPESCGVSSEWIVDFASELAKQLPNQVPHGWALYRHKKLLAKAIYKPFDDTTPQMVCSVSKSFTSTAIGFCVQEGLVKVTDKIADYFPDKLPENVQKEMLNVTVEDLLSMRVGQKSEIVHKGADNKDEPDRVRDFFSNPIVYPVGSVFGYNGSLTHTLAALVNRLTGMDILDYLNDRLFKKLGMPIPPTPRTAAGLIWADSGMRFTQDQIARLGQLYLDKGVWNGEQILSREWCESATSAHIGTENCGTGIDWQQGYCYQFWRGRHNTFRFCGAYGQFCIVMPDLDAMFVYQGGTDNEKIQFVVPIFYDMIMSKMRGDVDVLPENPEAFAKMQKMLSELTVNCINSTKSPLESAICKQKFTSDLVNLKEITFDFEGDRLTVDATVSDGTHLAYPAGRHGYECTDSRMRSSFCHMDECDDSVYASSFYWEQPGHLVVTTHMLASMTMFKIDAIFDREGAKISLKTVRGKYDK